ncbi:MAG: hypothetical protein WDW38_000579 [Sanguina aurantia]
MPPAQSQARGFLRLFSGSGLRSASGGSAAAPSDTLLSSSFGDTSVLAVSGRVWAARQQLTGLRTAFSTVAAPHRRGVAPSLTSSIKQLLQDYKQLSKAKLSALVVLTAVSGYVAGSGDEIAWEGMAWTALGTFASSACANTLNQLYEINNDSRMARTRGRPLPTGRLSTLHGAAFAVVTGAAGVAILYSQTNPLTASLGAANILLYAGVYTPLKQLSIANTWVGALVGAIPPLMGWAAAAGNLAPGAAFLGGALFAWQLPHFLALAWFCKEDYIKGGFRMLSMADPTGRRTGWVALRYSLALTAAGVGAVGLGLTTMPFALEAGVLGAIMSVRSVQFLAAPSDLGARLLFKSSLVYLPLLLAGLAFHRLPNDSTTAAADFAELQATMFQWVCTGLGLMHDFLLASVAASGVAVAVEVLRGGLEDEANNTNGFQCPSKVYGDSEGMVEGEESLQGVVVGSTEVVSVEPASSGESQ